MKKYEYSNDGYPPLISQGFKDILIDYLGIEEKDIRPDAKFVEDLGCDSLDVVELIINTEHIYNISISDEQAEQCYTVMDAVKLINELIEKKRRR